MSPQSADTLAPCVPSSAVLHEARAQVWTEGWTVIPDVMPEPVLSALSAEAERLLGEVRPGVNRTSATDQTGGVLVMNGLDARSELLFELARAEAFTTIAEALLGKAAIPIHTEYFGKPAAGALPTPPHQDQVFYESHFCDEPAITFWTPLQDTAVGDGALEYGSPCPPVGRLLLHRQSDCPDFGAELADAANYHFMPAPVTRGSCLIHHSYVVHRSGAMTSSAPRRVFAFNFRGSSYREYLRRAKAEG